MSDSPRTVEDVKALVDEHQLRFIRFWFTDILGQKRMKRSWCSSTMAFTSSTVRGWSVMAVDPKGSGLSPRSEDACRHVEPAAAAGGQDLATAVGFRGRCVLLWPKGRPVGRPESS